MPISDILGTLTNLGLSEVLLWLLTFAIVNGMMTQAGMFQRSRETRAIVAIVAGLLVVLATPVSLIQTISSMSSSMILIVMGILVLIVFLEIMGVKHVEYIDTGKKDKEGAPVYQAQAVNLFSRNPLITGIVVLIIVVLIFFAAGGAQILGVEGIEITNETITSVILIIAIILAIMWMIQEPGPVKKFRA